MKGANLTYSIPWNLFLITMGSLVAGIGLKAIVIPHGMITGGFSGLGILIYYHTGSLSPAAWYFVLNIPIFIVGWLLISRRFFFYSLYGAALLTLAMALVQFEITVTDSMLAAVCGGAIVGAGAGIIFRSLGSAGGNDIISVMLNQRFGIRIGTYNFMFNFLLFLCSLKTLNIDLVLYSMVTSFVSSQVIEYFMTLFNQRKMMLIISLNQQKIAHEIMKKLKRGVTFLNGQGAYTGNEKQVILTVVNTFQIKRVEEIVFTIDPDAFVITENTFNVLGRGFSRRKVY